VSNGEAVDRRPSCSEATRSMKTARHETKMRIALTPVKLIGNHDQKSARSAPCLYLFCLGIPT
jgi:hypothetical protein